MTNLSAIQMEFLACSVKLLQHILASGYQLTYGDAYRDKGCPHGKPGGAHSKRLALDLNLFLDGVYLVKTSDHKIFGDFWKKLHPLARWGGDFEDGNHYSFEYEGVK